MQNPRSKFVDIPQDISELLKDDEDTEGNARLLSPWARENEIDLKINDGDCLIIDRAGYRNDGKFLWDAQKRQVISFAYDLDDYGCIPPEFSIRRFPPHYFWIILEHNSFIRLDKGIVNQIVEHAVYENCPVTVKLLKPQKVVWSYFMLGKEKYHVIGVPVDCGYVSQRVAEETAHGTLMIHSEKTPELHPSSVEYAVNFMRMFIDAVEKHQITFRNEQTGEEDAENILFVSC